VAKRQIGQRDDSFSYLCQSEEGGRNDMNVGHGDNAEKKGVTGEIRDENVGRIVKGTQREKTLIRSWEGDEKEYP